MTSLRFRKIASIILSALLIFGGTTTAYAGMIGTHEVVAAATEIDRAEIMATLDSQEVIAELEAAGVDHEYAKERVAALSDQELAQLQSQFDEQVAGEGVVGVLLTLFIIFVITDMLCATDLFSFVKCINR